MIMFQTVTLAVIKNVTIKKVGLEKEDAMNWARWRVGVGEIAVRVG